MFNFIKSSPSLDLHSLIIIRNGAIISETYWHPYDINTTHNIKSASKSILSALTGIAIERKCIKSIDQKISEFLPKDFLDSLKSEILIYNLLTMTTGLDWKEDVGPTPFEIESWKKVPMKNKPGEKFEYNTAMTHMMSTILTSTCGNNTKEFADLWLFKPLKINNYQWRLNDNGIYHGGSNLFLTPRDMGKFGLLYLNKGNWGNQKIVTEDWIKSSTSKVFDIPNEQNPTEDYGYWWWIQNNTYMAYGAGGQIIKINPQLNLVIVITANSFNDQNTFDNTFDKITNKYIYPAVKSTKSLSEKPENIEKLKEINNEFKYPPLNESKYELSDTYLVSNKTYILAHNSIGIKSISLCFTDTSCIWTYRIYDKEIKLHIGLANRCIINEVDFSLGVNPVGEKIACKGEWVGNAFKIEHHIIGDPSKQTFSFSFSGDSILMNIGSSMMRLEIKGKEITKNETDE
ncbi:hypothetical protein ES708_28338 [subsurface metagenome]